MAGSSSIIPNAAEPDQPLFLINLSHCRTLTPLISLTWASQITSILFGLDLLKFVDGTYLKPEDNINITTPAVAASDDEPAKPTTTTSVPNPVAKTWCRQDRLILGALIGTLVPAVAPLVHQATTSHEVWTTLNTTYAHPSRGHILQIKDNLANLTKNQLSVLDYMNTVKSYTDKLVILGKPMDPEGL